MQMRLPCYAWWAPRMITIVYRSARELKLDSGKTPVGPTSSSEHRSHTKKCAPSAIEPDAGPHHDRTDERVHDEPETDVCVDVGVLMGIEGRARFEPGASVNAAAKKVRQPPDLTQISGGERCVMITGPFADFEGVKTEWLAENES